MNLFGSGGFPRRAGVRGLLIAAVVVALSSATGAVAFGGSGGFAVEIRRTGYGIPHITAHDFGSLGYGYGYAFAQDNLCVLAERVVTLRGERSMYLGADVDSDAYYRGVRDSGVVQRLLARPAPLGPTVQLRRLVDGYVAGYNRYLRDTGVANLPDPTCRGAAWVAPITAADMWSSVYDVALLNGTGRVTSDIVAAAPPQPGAAVTPRTVTPRTVTPRAVAPGEGNGSNGWALGRDVTGAHDGMLFANPHFPWAGDFRFYQVQLTIPGVLDVSGASLYGTPVVEIGHTRSLAWTHTTSTAERAVVRRLALVPGEPTSYLVDGKPEPMGRQSVTVAVRGADGTMSTVARTLYHSRYGPVLGTGWTTGAAYAFEDANADNLRAMNEWLALDQASSLTQLRTAEFTYQGIPFTNTIAVDADGTASFADAGVVPHVTDAQAGRCGVVSPDGDFVSMVLDGSTTSCDPGSDPDAIEPGIFGPGAYPRLTRTDYVANSNNPPQWTNPTAGPLRYPHVFGGTGELDLRPRLGLDMIARRRAGTDGLGAPGFTLPTLQATVFDDRNYSADLGRADVVAMCRAHPTLTAGDGQQVDVRQACAALAAWNGRGDLGVAGPVLWRVLFGGLPGGEDGWWLVPFDPAHPTTTPRGIDGNDPVVRRALADAVQLLQADGIPVTTTLDRIQHYLSVPLHGCTGDEGCFDVIEAGSISRDSDVKFGSSFVMAVELTRDGPRSRTVLTYSESADPTSAHHTDQTVLFSGKQWVTERFTDDEIAADPGLQTTTLRG